MDERELLDIFRDIQHSENYWALDLSNRGITRLPSEIGNLSKIYSLNLKGNNIETLPVEVKFLKNLHILDLSLNSISQIPNEICEVENLLSIDLTKNKLKTLPNDINKLKKLERLNLSYNQLSVIPEEVFLLRQLKTLTISSNKLSLIPKQLCNLVNLKSLVLSNNELTTLPEEIAKLTELEELYIVNNKLYNLPKEIGLLVKLRILNLKGNKLKEIPLTFQHLKKLCVLNLQDNLIQIPPEILILEDKPTELINYFAKYQTTSNLQELNEAKVIIVGQGSVGKTSLVKRLIDNHYDKHEVPTEGISIRKWSTNTPNGKRIVLNIWDFGGQEIMHATHQFFLTKRSIYILVVDARQGEQDSKIEYWLKMIQSFGGNSPIIVVTNKTDFFKLDIDQRGLKLKYPNIFGFTDISCAKNTGIEELKAFISEAVSRLEHLSDKLMSNWFAVKNKLEQLRQDYIGYEQYAVICNREGVEDKISQTTLINLMHDLGIIISFQDDFRLCDTNILKPEWLTNGVYTILNSHQLCNNKGQLEIALLKKILDQERYPHHKYLFIIDLMRKFELCFYFKEETVQRILIPELLGKEEPNLNWNGTGSLTFQYHYNFLPSSIISRFIVNIRTYIDEQNYWRTGVLIKNEGNTALIKADLEDKKIIISIKGKETSKRSFLSVIREYFYSIHKSVPKIEFYEKIVLPEHNDVIVDYKYLLDLEDMGEETFVPPGLKKKLFVKDVLDGFRPPKQAYLVKEEEEKVLLPRIGIITALPKEHVAVEAMLRNQEEKIFPGRGTGNKYLLGEIVSDTDNKVIVALALLPDMGNNFAAIRTTRFLDHFPNIETIIMVGIAGGIPYPTKPDEHVRLGDVVVCNRQGVVQYDYVKETFEETKHTTPPRPPSSTLLEGIKYLEVEEKKRNYPWVKYIDKICSILEISRPLDEEDSLFDSTDPSKQLYHPKDPKRIPNYPRIFSGPIASANNLLKNPVKRDLLRDKFGAKAVEMEGSGIADSTWSLEINYMVIRGICDYCDSKKSDIWQDYAAVVASAYTLALIESVFCKKPLS